MTPPAPIEPAATRPPPPTQGAAALPANIADWIAYGAQRHPNRRCWADDSADFTYAEAAARVARLAQWLVDHEVRRGDRVAVWLGNRVTTLEALFASAWIGAIALPINARLTPSEVAFQLEDSESRLVFIEPAWIDAGREAISRMTGRTPDLVAAGPDLEASVARVEAASPCVSVSPEDPVILMYTSGTTGKPKGALLPHRKALYNSLNAQDYFDLRGDDHVLVVAPLFHSLGLQILALPALYAGASLRIQDGFDPGRVWQTIELERITYYGGVPTMHQRLLEALSSPVTTTVSRPPSSLRFAFTAGAAAPIELIRSFHAHGLQLKQGYGQTETSTLTCLDPENALGKAGSVGRPVRHGEVRLIDPSTIEGPTSGWRDAGVGDVGEVVVRGPITMLGYWRRPEATAETIRDGWLRTGDLATRDEDFDITLVGRAREMFISGGENVYPAEIEACLVEHPDILEAAVVAIDDPEWGEAGRAHVVAREGATLDVASVRQWFESRLARYKRPREIVIDSALPRTASGKIQKHRLGAPQ